MKLPEDLAGLVNLSPTLRKAVRALALGDLFFLLVYVLRREDVNNDWLYHRCREVAADPDDHLDLWARGHYKSTIITFALTIQEILADPELTVLFLSYNRPTAKAFLVQVKRELEDNQFLKWLFPDVLWGDPEKEAPKWSEDGGLVVRRKTNPKEATLEAFGLVDGQPTGRHYRLIVYDDVVTEAAVSTPEMIDKVTKAWALSLNIVADPHRKRYAGTRYHANDTYREMVKRKAAEPRIHAATDDGTMQGTPVFLSREILEAKRREMGPYVFACQMLLNPVADNVQSFKGEWVKTWNPRTLSGMNVYILVDPASKKKKTNDYTAMSVIALGQDRNYYTAFFMRDRLSLGERARLLFKLHATYQPIAVGYEEYGMQADIDYIKELQDERNYHFPVIDLGGRLDNDDRIKKLIPLFETGRWYLPMRCYYTNYEGVQQDMTQVFLDEEYLWFPVGVHDDMLVSMARVLDDKLGAFFPAPAESYRGAGQEYADNDYKPFS